VTNRIKPSQAQTVVRDLEKKLDAIANGKTSLKASALQDDPILSSLAKTVTTSCASSPSVSVAKMKEALKTIGVSIANADKNNDGEIGYVEASRLSPLALRMLDMAAGDKADVPSRPTTTPTPAPSRPVSTGCGSSPAPTPPVRTGC